MGESLIEWLEMLYNVHTKKRVLESLIETLKTYRDNEDNFKEVKRGK